jgi:hypothetical protein
MEEGTGMSAMDVLCAWLLAELGMKRRRVEHIHGANRRQRKVLIAFRSF